MSFFFLFLLFAIRKKIATTKARIPSAISQVFFVPVEEDVVVEMMDVSDEEGESVRGLSNEVTD